MDDLKAKAHLLGKPCDDCDHFSEEIQWCTVSGYTEKWCPPPEEWTCKHWVNIPTEAVISKEEIDQLLDIMQGVENGKRGNS